MVFRRDSLYNPAVPQRKRAVSWTPLRDGIFSGLIVFVAALASLLWLDWVATQYQKELIQGSLERTARGVAGLVNGDLHEKVIRDATVDSDDYRQALAPLVRYHKGVPEIAYLYTLVVKDGELHFGLDTAEEAQQLGFKREMEASPVMETYHSKMPEEDAAEIAAITAASSSGILL